MNTMGAPNRGDDVMSTYSPKGPTAVDHASANVEPATFPRNPMG